jgi:hypothetical protein
VQVQGARSTADLIAAVAAAEHAIGMP